MCIEVIIPVMFGPNSVPCTFQFLSSSIHTWPQSAHSRLYAVCCCVVTGLGLLGISVTVFENILFGFFMLALPHLSHFLGQCFTNSVGFLLCDTPSCPGLRPGFAFADAGTLPDAFAAAVFFFCLVGIEFCEDGVCGFS